MNDTFSLCRPIVFVCSAVIVLSTTLLNYPTHSLIILILASISAGIIFVLLFVSGNKCVAFFLSVLIVLGAASPYVAYISKEKYAHSVIETLGDNEYTFSGEVVHASSSSKPANVRVRVSHINNREVRKPFYVQVTSFSGDLPENGDSILFKGKPSLIDSSDNTGFDTKTYLRSKNTFIKVYGAQFISNSTNKKSDLLFVLRSRYEKAVYTYVKDGYSYKAPSIVKALTIADKSDFTKSISQDFAKSGLSHLMCVSGLHLCVLLGMVASFLRWLSIHKNVRCILLIGFCVFYILFTGGSPSVIRAAFMACFTYIALLTGRKNDSVIALFASGAAITILNPYVVLDISAKLSFVSTLGVILMWNVSDKLFSRLGQRNSLACGVLGTILVNIGAVSLTLPLGADIFGGFSTVGIPATLMTSLACEILIILSNILCVLSFVPFLDFLCASLGKICTCLSLYILNTAEWFSSLKYSYVEAENTQIMLIASSVFILLLALFISFGASKAVRLTLLAIVTLCFIMSVTGVANAIKHDGELCVSYYRKNKDDRQLSVKLGRNGYLIFNSDDVLCTNSQNANFDTISGKNHIILIPDKENDASILADNLIAFRERYGIKGVFVPDNPDGFLLSQKLSSFGIECYIFPDSFEFDGFSVSFSSDKPGFYSICVNDKYREIFIVFADKYSKDYFDRHTDICAYFTRETKTQFNPSQDSPPDCNLFFTRTHKGFEQVGIFNTFGKTNFDLKE